MKEFVAYSKKLYRLLKQIKELIEDEEYEKAKKRLDELLEDTEGDIQA